MGTNYYLHENICPHCGRGDEPLHIGKSSGGWCFALHVIPELGLNTLNDWEKRWRGAQAVIKNEYGDAIPSSMMIATIVSRNHASIGGLGASWYEQNHAEPGPQGLARHKIGAAGGCVGHGEGTWDYIQGEFS